MPKLPPIYASVRVNGCITFAFWIMVILVIIAFAG